MRTTGRLCGGCRGKGAHDRGCRPIRARDWSPATVPPAASHDASAHPEPQLRVPVIRTRLARRCATPPQQGGDAASSCIIARIGCVACSCRDDALAGVRLQTPSARPPLPPLEMSAPGKACSVCLASYPDSAYSGAQLKKKGKRVCRACVTLQTHAEKMAQVATATAAAAAHRSVEASFNLAQQAFWQEHGKPNAAAASAALAANPFAYSDHSSFFGQRDDDGLPHGQGLRMDAAGAIINGQCGVFQHGTLLKQSAVTRALLPANTPLRPHALKAHSIRPDGSCLVWSDDTHATLFDADGRELRGGGWNRETNTQEGSGFSITPATGDVFRGQFEADKPHVGTLTFKNGNVLEGLFSQAGRTTIGTMTMPNGAILRGTFSSSWKLEGAGISVAPLVTEWNPAAAASSSSAASSASSSSAAASSADSRFAFFSHRRFPDAAEPEDPDGSLHALPGVVYSGSFVHGQRCGAGAEWNAQGAVTACGVWSGGVLQDAATIRMDALFPGAAALKKPFLAELGTIYSSPASSSTAAAKHAPIDLSFLPASARSATLLFEDGSFYSGELDRAVTFTLLPYGAGEIFNADASLRERGIYDRPGLLHCSEGVRVLRYNRGEYRGPFRKGQPHGHGVWRSVPWHHSEPSSSGATAAAALPYDRYEGEWVRGFKSGEGEMRYSDGSVYFGHWRDDREGLGVLTSADGLTVREGVWAAGRANGVGVEWAADGSRRVGLWSHDKFIAECPVPRALLPVGSKLTAAERDATMLFPDGSSFHGVLPSDSFGTPGRGRLFDKDGRVQSSGLFVSTLTHVACSDSDAADGAEAATCNHATAAAPSPSSASSTRATTTPKHSTRGGRK